MNSDVTIVNRGQNDYSSRTLIYVPDDVAAKRVAHAKALSLSLLYWMQTEAPRPDGGIEWKGLRLRDADRFTGSFQFTNRPTSFFNHRFILGVDRLAENNEDRTPRNDLIGATYASFAGSGLPPLVPSRPRPAM